jgi:hypothetical protein
MRARLRRRTTWLAALVLLAGCGKNYVPSQLDTTGVPASPLGQVIDVEVHLGHLKLPEAQFAGVDLDIRFEMAEAGYGALDARVIYGPARYDWTRTEVEVEDLGDGTATVYVTGERWNTGRLGPLRIGTTVFELLLDGVPERGGRYVSGKAWETLTALESGFEGWRRHRFLVAGTDFFSGVGRISEVALVKEREIVVRNGLETVSSDPFLRVTGGAVFAVNRFTHDNLQRLDPDGDYATSWQAGMGAGSNPHDVAVLSPEKGYVTRYEPPFDDVGVFDPGGGGVELSIPLESLAENPDGTPRADRMRLVDGTLFVGLQNIDRTFTVFGEGKLAVVDTMLDEPAGAIPLGGKNPSSIEVLRGADGRTRLYVALSGILPGLQPQELSGGVVVVDAVQRAVERMALDDDDAGGNVGALAMASEQLGYVVVSDESFFNRVIAFDPAAATVRRTLLGTADFVPELEVDGDGVLAVPDRSFFEPRLCLYRVPTDPTIPEELVGCGSLDVPPFSVEALD